MSVAVEENRWNPDEMGAALDIMMDKQASAVNYLEETFGVDAEKAEDFYRTAEQAYEDAQQEDSDSWREISDALYNTYPSYFQDATYLREIRKALL